MPERRTLREALRTVDASDPRGRKLLVAPSPASARELLRATTRSGHGWIGWEPTSPLQVARECSRAAFDGRVVEPIDEFEEIALLDRAVEAVRGQATEEIRSLLSNAAARDELLRSVRRRRNLLEGERALAGGDVPDTEGFTAALVRAFERILAEEERLDRPGLYTRLLGCSDDALLRTAGDADGSLPRIVLLPGLPAEGVEGRWVERIAALPGALQATSDSRRFGGAEAARLEIMAATSPMEELRESLRRATAAGLPFDEVEIVVSDVGRYLPLIDGLAHQLEVPLTASAGIDTARVPLGRWVSVFLDWLRQDRPLSGVLELVERGAIRPTRGSSESAARWYAELRRYPGVRGADGYAWIRDRLVAEVTPPLSELSETLGRLVGGWAGGNRMRVSPAVLAASVRTFLQLASEGNESHEALRLVLLDRVDRISETLLAPLPFSQAIQRLDGLLRTRIARPEDGKSGSWTSLPGRLHISDLSTGGYTGRSATFVLGLDADRVGRATDSSTGGESDGSGVVRRLLDRIDASLTVSYAAWNGSDGRAVSPAPVLLELLRERSGDAALGYEALRAATTPLVGPVLEGRPALDETDVWLNRLHVDRIPRPGRPAVLEAFPLLGRGESSFVRRPVNPTEHRIEIPASGRPTRYSASALEDLGSCPRRFFYRHLLRIRAPDPLESDRFRWLDARERGTRLHQVFERILRELGPLDRTRDLEGLDRIADRVVREVFEEEGPGRRRVNSFVVARELGELREDVREFCRMIEHTRPYWTALETEFGVEGHVPVEVEDARGVRWPLRGQIDRTDRVGPELLRVVDYKTGSADAFSRDAPLAGGRRLQHWLYLRAAEILAERSVESAEYHFPTRRGRGRIAGFERSDLERAPELLASLGEALTEGLFVTTDDVGDCASCDFMPVCRATRNEWRTVTCARVARTKADLKDKDPALRALARIRGIDDE